MKVRCCVRCEEIIGEDENTAELEGVTYHVACLIADLLEQILQRDQIIKELEQETGRRAK